MLAADLGGAKNTLPVSRASSWGDTPTFWDAKYAVGRIGYTDICGEFKRGAGLLTDWWATDSSNYIYQDTDPSFERLKSIVSQHSLEESETLHAALTNLKTYHHFKG